MHEVKKIAVLMGGWSAERDVSLRSGELVSSVLGDMGYEVEKIDVVKDLKYISDELYQASPDFVFNVLHGTGGEDGVIQGVLEIFGIPYSNSGVLSSAICFDKDSCKKIVQNAGILVADWFCVTKDDVKKLGLAIDVEYPFVMKPSANGSSVGCFLICSEEELKEIRNVEWRFGEKIIVEKYIKGRELTAAVVDGKFVGAIEILYDAVFYDYSSKYESPKTLHIPAFANEKEILNDVCDMCEKIFKICGCRGCARLDMIYDGKNIYFLEINTQPGFTSGSLVPDIARINNISFQDLLRMQIH